jgi:imidazolonepropionase-like amidohydrolase
MRIFGAWVLFGSLALSTVALSATTPRLVIYWGASLIDTAQGVVRPDTSIVIEGQRIKAVVPTRRLVAQDVQNAQVFDMTGRFVLPGLIDSHEHLATPPDRKFAEAMMRRDLYSGITAVRDMADDLRSVGELARESLLGEIPGPDIYYAALMAGPSFFNDRRTGEAAQGAVAGSVPWMQAITDQTDMPIAVALARGTYATGIKIYANLPGSLVKKITTEAHRQGILVWAHAAVFPASPKEVIEAGVDSVSHVCYLTYQVYDKMPESYQKRFDNDDSRFAQGDDPRIAALLAEMQRRGTILDATVSIHASFEQHVAQHPQRKIYLCSSRLALQLTNQAYRAGVQISTGTDEVSPASDRYPQLYAELTQLGAGAHLPNAQVLKSATLIGARALGHESEMGTIEPGKLANLVFVEKSPLENIGNLRTVVLTVKRGVRYPRADYRPVRPEEMPEEYRE